MNNKIDTIIKTIRTNNNTLYAEEAFRYFIDNQISDDELIEILNADNFHLPSSFKEMPIKDKKSFLAHNMVRVAFEGGVEQPYSYETFNSNYFYALAEHAKKNKSLTKQLIDYVSAIGVDNVNLLFLGMQHIKLNNTSLINYETIQEYAKLHKLNNVYDLLVILFSDKESIKGVKQLKFLVTEQIKKPSLFEIDLKLPFVEFALLMECALAKLTNKEANTLKVIYKILEKGQLRENEYYADKTYQNRLVNTFKKKIKDNRILAHLSGFVINHESEYFSFPPNGYSALYLSAMEEGE